jgi:hypothetical protein
VKKTSLFLVVAVFLVVVSLFSFSNQCQAGDSPYNKALNHFGLMEHDGLFAPVIYIGNGYVMVPKIFVWDKEKGLFMKPTFIYTDQKDTNPKLIADYEGIVMYQTTIKTLFSETAFVSPQENGQDVYFVTLDVSQDGTRLDLSAPVLSAKISQVKSNTFLIDQAFHGGYVGTGIFDKKGRLLGIASGNLFSWVVGDIQLPAYGTAISAKVFAHFQSASQAR